MRLLGDADAAVYRAKAKGHGRVELIPLGLPRKLLPS